MPLCRECFDYKTKQQNEQTKNDVQVLLSESKSTNYNDSEEGAGDNCLDMRGLTLIE